MKNMKIILETWKRFEESSDCENYSPVTLIENNRRTKIDFLTLLERKDISESQLTTILTKSFDHELTSILKEGMLDSLSDFISNTMNKAKALLQRGKLQGLILLNKLKDSASKFQGEHPKIAKAVVILVAAAAAYFLMDFLAGAQAHAAIVDIDPGSLQVITGAVDSLQTAAMKAGDMDTAKALQIAIETLKKGHQTATEMQFSQVIDSMPDYSQVELRKAFDFISKLSQEAKAEGADSEAQAMLQSARAVGELILRSK